MGLAFGAVRPERKTVTLNLVVFRHHSLCISRTDISGCCRARLRGPSSESGKTINKDSETFFIFVVHSTVCVVAPQNSFILRPSQQSDEKKYK